MRYAGTAHWQRFFEPLRHGDHREIEMRCLTVARQLKFEVDYQV